MENKKEEIKKEIQLLLGIGLQLLANETDSEIQGADLQKQNNPDSLIIAYNSWYTKCLPILKIIAPERYDDFVECYKNLNPRKGLTYENYTISDYLKKARIIGVENLSEVTKSAFTIKFQIQVSIINAALRQVDYTLKDIEGLLQADMFDNEIDSAKELLRNSHNRAGGALAGVVLERHLKNLISSHEIETERQLTISSANELLKRNSVYGIETWRKIQWLGDIRNQCAHDSERAPSVDDVTDMISSVERIIKTVF